jgi:acetyl-CoA decarbonylase/synthase complex subunit gamma
MDFSTLSIVRPQEISSDWLSKDHQGALRVRFSIGRNRYRVDPGLYRLGQPGRDSEVLVSANYKLSFDILRRSLSGRGAWILVLETFGINVWCAAGKGTFGSDELIRQVKDSQLNLYVSHKRLIVPQLGAPGISAHKVKEATGYSVKFGPVRAEDIKDYISAGYKKDEVSRTVQFKIKDRFILTAVELANSLRYLIIAIILFALLSGIHTEGYSFELIWKEGLKAGLYLLAAYFSGAFLAPLLLPLMPFRHFGGKGMVSGLLVFGLIALIGNLALPLLALLAWFLISGAISSYLTMNFTGASTYTSLSGVRKEMGIFVPIQIAFALAGLALLIVSKLI